jgi:hypothetical protein
MRPVVGPRPSMDCHQALAVTRRQRANVFELCGASAYGDQGKRDETRDVVHLAHSLRALAIIMLTKADLVMPAGRTCA